MAEIKYSDLTPESTVAAADLLALAVSQGGNPETFASGVARVGTLLDDLWKRIDVQTVSGADVDEVMFANTDALTGVSTGAKTFTVSRDVTSSLVDGQIIRVDGSTGNDGNYTLDGTPSFAGGSTTITVAEAIPDATVDGSVIHLPQYDEYRLMYDIIGASNQWVLIRFNGDADSNYYRDVNDTNQTSAQVTYVTSDGSAFGYMNIHLATDGRRYLISGAVRYYGGQADGQWINIMHSPTTGGLTAISLIPTSGNGIAVGSKLALFGRNIWGV